MSEMGNIQWFPGHMTKTRRMIQSNLSLVDGVVEILDARIPDSSRNPEMDRLVKDKPRMFILNKADMADENATSKWINHYKSKGVTVIKCNCKTGDGIKSFLPAVKNQLLAELMEKRRSKGIDGAPLRLMIVGIPNVGKSSFINKMAKSKKAKVEDRPGVTRDKQWVSTGIGVDLLDMPGILWPKFDDKLTAENLALTGALKDDILDTEALAVILCNRLRALYPDRLVQRYKLGDIKDIEGLTDYELFELIGKKRGFLMSGGCINTERTADMLLDELRGSRLGRITLDRL